MLPIKCFFLEPTGLYHRQLRRYSRGDDLCGGRSYHNADVFLDVIEHKEPGRHVSDDPDESGIARSDSRWPTKCEDCDYVFKENDYWQIFVQQLYVRQDTGEQMTIREAPAGAMWFCDWMMHQTPSGIWLRQGPDGHCLCVACPPDGHQWIVDSQASNCDKKGDLEHKCWCRHGTPPKITVDKSCNTCGAGGGSIQTTQWHGFLENGYLVENRGDAPKD